MERPGKRASRISRTGDAHAEHNSIANSGYLNIENLHLAGPAVSGYIEQVRRIAPTQLLGRDTELAALAAYCTSDVGDAYQWWRAGAWAGKSALMAWFALNPPANVRIVSFFITARLGAQNDREAFTPVVLEQLAEILGQALPPLLTPATQDAHFLRLLREAAEVCDERGERLVLLVDGLDEDRGVTTGPDAHSIAALLPARLAGSLRVLVSGRPNPPIPADVAEDHPLRNPGIVRKLAVSAHAQAIRVEAERELKRLLSAGGGIEREILGLVTAAGGGLSLRDLDELMEASTYQIGDTLSSFMGRTFEVRASAFGADGKVHETFLLAHEELHLRAEFMMGHHALHTYRQRLHEWAEAYKDNYWPSGAPEYLFRGYFSMLNSTHDLRRMISCGTDPERHQRMLEFSGGDAAALNEIRVAQGRIIEHENDYLIDMIRLSFFRDYLNERNAQIPRGLPSAWVLVGQKIRAEALARSIPQTRNRCAELIFVARELANSGDNGRASIVARDALILADKKELQCSALTLLARVAKDPEEINNFLRRAEGVAQIIESPYSKVLALSEMAIVVAEKGLPDSIRLLSDAEGIARETCSGYERQQALALIGMGLAQIGRTEEALHIANCDIADYERTQVLVSVSRDLALRGNTQDAVPVLAVAEREARGLDPALHQDCCLPELAKSFFVAGNLGKAVEILDEADSRASESFDPDQEATKVAAALAFIGDIDRSIEILSGYQARANGYSNGQDRRVDNYLYLFQQRYTPSADLVATFVALNRTDLAIDFIGGLDSKMKRRHFSYLVRALTVIQERGVIDPLIRAEQYSGVSSVRVLNIAENAANASASLSSILDLISQMGDPVEKLHALAAITESLAFMGHERKAVKLLSLAGKSNERFQYDGASGVMGVMKGLMEKGRLSEALKLAGSLSDSYSLDAFAGTAKATLNSESLRGEVGAIVDEIRVVHTVTPSPERRALAGMIEVLLESDKVSQAVELLTEAESRARSYLDNVRLKTPYLNQQTIMQDFLVMPWDQAIKNLPVADISPSVCVDIAAALMLERTRAD
ncbi:hypothetical protein AB0N62_23280 [Streptomyces sp. NPDC093982]|uniref:hypothetical protein n=1 Tax=Streptomyces sp. NPDC093982 TaxID=3155077 RepID=UPI0034427497